MADSISECSRAMVLPAQPTTPHPFFLSCLDLFWKDIHYNQRLIFYESPLPQGSDGQAAPQDGRAAALMEKLKSSLALCLVHYYPWCGRIAKSTEPPHRLFIDCCDAGVEFVEASSSLPLSHLARDGFQMKPFFQHLCQQPDYKGDCLFSSPLLSIQATLFSDGGLVLGIAQSHVVADGQSLWDFMVSWGECARGVPLSLPPLHNREMLAIPDPSLEKATWSLKLQINEEDKGEEERFSGKANPSTGKDEDHTDVLVDNRADDSHAGTTAAGSEDSTNHAEMDQNKESSAGSDASSGGDTPKPLVQFVLDLSAAAIKKLKSEAGGGHTSFEVICAHFWKRLAAAREIAASEPTYFFAPVGCRTRMTPPIPPAYFGNVVGFDVILSTQGAIRRETLCATACRIHNLVAKMKEDVILAFMHWLETHNHSMIEAFPPTTPLGKGVHTASSPWFPAYQVDYGWGKPAAVRSAKVPGEGELVLFGGRPGSMRGDVEICTALPEGVLKRLLEDPDFLARAPSSRFG